MHVFRMKCVFRVVASFVVPVFLLTGAAPDALAGSYPVMDLTDASAAGGHVMDWIVVGPFPFPKEEQQVYEGSSSVDYLESLGGEAGARLESGTAVTFRMADGTSETRDAFEVRAAGNGLVDLAEAFRGEEFTVAYASTVLKAGRNKSMHAFMGSDDLAQVWLNGELIHSDRSPQGGRACVARQEHFELPLKHGENTVLIKINQVTGPWEFIFEVMPSKEAEAVLAEKVRMDAVRRVMDARLVPEHEWGWTFWPGNLPSVGLDLQDDLDTACGDNPLVVRWFDADLNAVTSAETPGRYIAYAEREMLDGRKIRRAATFFCTPPDWQPWRQRPKVTLPNRPLHPAIDPAVWGEHAGSLEEWAGGKLLDSFFRDPDSAALLASMHELETVGQEPLQTDTAMTREQDVHLRLKLNLLGMEGKWPALAPPAKLDTPAPTLRVGTPAEVGMREDAVELIREACRNWLEIGGEPFTICVAKRGVIVVHEAFGEQDGEPVSIQTPFETASLTKAITGLMLGQFIEQGLIGPDDSVGKFLPDFPVSGPQTVTIRHCMTHTTGLDGHGRWNGMANPWLDNVIANGVETLQPGRVLIYDGMSMDLVGKVMEVVSGKSIFRLLHENFYMPLGLDNPTQRDMAYGLKCSVGDLAIFGQFMLNKGSYGDLRYFGPDTMDILMPRAIRDDFPELADSKWFYGFGLMRGPTIPPDAGVDTMDPEELLFSPNTFGRGGASGTQLFVDPDHELIVAFSRSNQGEEYQACMYKLLYTIEEVMGE